MLSKRGMSIEILRYLYGVLMAITFIEAIKRFVLDTNLIDFDLKLEPTPLIVALLFTFIPFYHGASRYFEDVYIKQQAKTPSPKAFLTDFLILTLQAGLFFVLALLLKGQDPTLFFKIIMLILLIDIVWALLIVRLYAPASVFKSVENWGIINFGTLLFIAILVFFPCDNYTRCQSILIFSVISLFTVARTIIDYKVNWTFYFPD